MRSSRVMRVPWSCPGRGSRTVSQQNRRKDKPAHSGSAACLPGELSCRGGLGLSSGMGLEHPLPSTGYPDWGRCFLETSSAKSSLLLTLLIPKQKCWPGQSVEVISRPQAMQVVGLFKHRHSSGSAWLSCQSALEQVGCVVTWSTWVKTEV